MQKISEILNSDIEKLDKCKYCGKTYQKHEYKIFEGMPEERIMHVQAPACDCLKQREEQEKVKIEAEEKKEKLTKLFENSLITPYFQKKTFENLQIKANEYGNEKELKKLLQYAQNFKKGEMPGIFLTGKPGTGKTSMIAAVSNELMQRGFNVLFVTFSALMERFLKYSAEHNGDIYPLLMWLVKFDFVVIDDLGRENYTDRRKEIAYRIIDTLLCYEVPTGFTANPEMIERLRKIEDWNAILDRLKDICGLAINFKGESIRGHKWQLA